MIKLLIFDIGGVIIDFTEDEYIFYISKKLGVNFDTFSNTLRPMLKKMDLGTLKTPEVEARLARVLKVPKIDLEWVRTYRKLATLNRQVAHLTSGLSKKYELVLLTNISASRYLESLRLLKHVKRKRVFTSYHLHLRKPDARIYRYVLRKMHCKPAEAVFVDNMLENVEGAQRVGIRSILFVSTTQLKRDLAHLGVRA